MAIQMRRGQYKDLDPDKLLPGEWAVSLDERYVHMCFAPGVIMRMATYDAFEKDMLEVGKILKECQSVENAAKEIEARIGKQVEVITDLTDKARKSAETAEQKAVEASGSADRAVSAAESALQNAGLAEQSAASTLESKSLAEEAAADAGKYAVNAEQAENGAEEQAEQAAQSAERAGESASLSVQKATEASGSALEAESYAHGNTGIRNGEETDHALYYKEQAKNEADRAKAEADRAQDIAGIGIASAEKAGLVKPDGNSIVIDEDGTIRANASGTGNYEELENLPAVNGVTLSGNKTLDELNIQQKGEYLTEETDPSVPEWAKQPEKPEYSKEEIGLGNVPDVATNDQTPTFTQAATRTNILSGEKLSVLFGKIKKWFADLKAVAFSGSYNDLSDTPDIPTKTSQLTNDSGFKTTDTTYSTMTGASASAAGKAGLVPAPAAGKQNAFLRGDGTWQAAPAAVTPVNNLLATVPGKPLDAVQGKVLADQISALNNLPSITALDVEISIKNGTGTLTDENIKSTSKILVTRKRYDHVDAAINAVFAYDGYATISINSVNATATIFQAYVLIINDI